MLVYKLLEEKIKDCFVFISYSFIDWNNNIWLCNEEIFYLYNIYILQIFQIKNEIGEDIIDIEQIDDIYFFIGME